MRITVNNRLPNGPRSHSPIGRDFDHAVCRREASKATAPTTRQTHRSVARWSTTSGPTATAPPGCPDLRRPTTHPPVHVPESRQRHPFRCKSGSGSRTTTVDFSPYDVANVTVTNRFPTTPSVTANSGPGPITGIVPRVVTFASTVTDPDICTQGSDEALTTKWDFGNGGTPNSIPTPSTPTRRAGCSPPTPRSRTRAGHR